MFNLIYHVIISTYNIKINEIYFLTKSLKSSVYFILTAHLNPDYPYFECPMVTGG